jgi:hypothetical protein
MGIKFTSAIKLLAISGLAFFALLTLIGLLFPAQIRSVKAIEINKPQHQVYNELVQKENWKRWYPFFYSNNGAAINEANKDTTIFFNEKKKLLLFNQKKDSNSISFTMLAFNGVQVNHTMLALPINGDSAATQVVWNETEKLQWYPWERFRGLLLESSKGIFLDTALYRFKKYIEAK